MLGALTIDRFWCPLEIQETAPKIQSQAVSTILVVQKAFA